MVVRNPIAVDASEQDLRDTVKRIRDREVLDPDRALRELLQAAEQLLQSREEAWVSTGSAAEQLGIGSINTIKSWVRQGILDGRLIRGRYHVAQRSIDNLLASGSERLQRERAHYTHVRALQEKDTLDASHEEAAPHLVRDRDLADQE